METTWRFPASSAAGFATPAASPWGKGRAVVVVQRTSADLKLDSHLHAIFLDAVIDASSRWPTLATLGVVAAGAPVYWLNVGRRR